MLAFIVIVAVSALYVHKNQDKILAVFTKEVNHFLEAEVKIKSAEVNIFSKFPNVSVQFSHVLCPDILQPADTLFYLKSAYFQFSLWEVIWGKYNLRQISLEDGEANIRVLDNGQGNYHFWKTSEDTTASDFSIDLQAISLKNIRISYTSAQPKLRLRAMIEQAQLKGAFEPEKIAAFADVSGEMQHFSMDNMTWKMPLEYSLLSEVSSEGDRLELTQGKAVFPGITMNLSGLSNEGTYRWKLETDKGDFNAFLRLVPPALLPKPEDYKTEGTLQLQCELSGNYGKTPLLSIAGNLAKGSLQLSKRDFWLKDLAFNASFTNGEKGTLATSALALSNFTGLTQGGKITGSMNIRNFDKPQIDLEADLQSGLYEIMQLVGPELFSHTEGVIRGKVKLSNRYTSIDAIAQKGIEGAQISGNLMLQEGALNLSKSNISLTGLSANVELNNPHIRITSASLTTGSNTVSFSGSFNHLLYGNNHPKLDVSANAAFVDVDEILAWEWPPETPSAKAKNMENTETTDNPPPFDYNVQVTLGKFKLSNWQGHNVSGRVYNVGGTIAGQKIAFQTLGGDLAGDFEFRPAAKNYRRLVINGRVNQIDMRSLFEAFDNFGQDVLNHKHLSGIATSNLMVDIHCNENYDFIPASLRLTADIDIKNGRLVNYPPMENLSRFVKVEDLRDVRFAKLSNTISIKNGVIEIPQMNIASSAIDLDLAGTHTFENQIDYAIRLKLRDALGAQKRKTGLEEWVVEESRPDEPYIWVSLRGSVDNPNISLDNKRIVKGIGKELKEEGRQFKDLFKKTDPEKEKEEKKKESKYIFEWEEG